MSESQRIDSPNQRFFILLASTEMRMSHWITSAALWAAHPQHLLLAIGDWQWSSEQIAWSADSRLVTIGLRRYPGDAPGIVIDIDPEQQLVFPHAPAATQPVPFAELNPFLEYYYAHNQRAKP